MIWYHQDFGGAPRTSPDGGFCETAHQAGIMIDLEVCLQRSRARRAYLAIPGDQCAENFAREYARFFAGKRRRNGSLSSR